MTPDKGPHVAADIARRAGIPLKIAGKCREPAEREFFDRELRPRLGDGISYVGELDFAGKVELLGNARALINPIDWPEPFGLVMIEALACGTPLLLYPNGAAPEIVRDGVNGFLCSDLDAMVEAVGQVAGIDRSKCRADVEERFTTERMVEDHLDLYRRLLEAAG